MREPGQYIGRLIRSIATSPSSSRALPAGLSAGTRTTDTFNASVWLCSALAALISQSSYKTGRPLTLSLLPCARVTQNRSADTEAAGSSYASGFIVDAKRGLILTNRHVVTPGMYFHREDVRRQPSVAVVLAPCAWVVA